MKQSLLHGLLVMAWCLGAAPALASDIHIEMTYARATPAGATTAAAFMVIRNDAKADDTLVSAVSPSAKIVQIHEMTMVGGIMRMREVQGGLKVPASGTVSLRPGGYHIMLIGVVRPMQKGQSFSLSLHFKNAGDVSVSVPVRSLSGD